MELSNRLETIASFVTEGYVVADIGTDHGYIPIYLTSNGNCPRAYAMDVNKEPLSRAKTHIEEENAGEVVSCILSDGLHELPQDDVDSIVIAGMGGDLVVRILEQDFDKLANVKELILSPQSHLERSETFLSDHGFRIFRRRNLAKEDGKYYVVIRAVHGKQQYDKECFYRFGEELILAKHPVLLEYLDQEYVKYSKIKESLTDDSKEHIRRRKEEVEDLLGDIMEALCYYELYRTDHIFRNRSSVRDSRRLG